MKTLEEVIKDRVAITSSLKETNLLDLRILSEDDFWFRSSFLKFENMFVENSIIVYQILKLLIYYLFSSYISINSKINFINYTIFL